MVWITGRLVAGRTPRFFVELLLRIQRWAARLQAVCAPCAWMNGSAL